MKKGKQKCRLWLGTEADGLTETTTSSVSDVADEIERLEKVLLLCEFSTCSQEVLTSPEFSI